MGSGFEVYGILTCRFDWNPLLPNFIIFSLEIVGRHPTEVEARAHDLSGNFPAFLDVTQDKLTSDYAKYLENIEAYFANNYSS